MRAARPIYPKKRLLPKLHATNAYQLLDQVVEAILAEPKRLHMGHWILWGKILGKYKKQDVPQCQTVGCMAGWICAIAHPQLAINTAKRKTDGLDVIWPMAAGLLGFQKDDLGGGTGLFSGTVIGSNGLILKPGQKGYVEAVVARVRAFQAAHAVRLIQRQINVT